jgi:hypothetical protein
MMDEAEPMSRRPSAGTILRAATLLAALAFLLFLGACGDDGGSDDDAGDDRPPVGDDGDDDDGEPTPVMDYVTIEGAPAPANPVTGAQTPPALNRVGFQRFRADTGDAPPQPVSAVLVLIGGHTIGGNEFHALARELVRLSRGEVEVWLLERRCHFLEDTWGMQRAEALRDPRIAHGYYFSGLAVDGRTFGGNPDGKGPVTEMMSEWGLDLEFADIRRVLSLVPDGLRQRTVFLGGHSRGVAFAEAFAAYRFPDGRRGTDDLAGLVLIDGGAKGGMPETEAEYLAWLDGLRRGARSRIYTIPFYPLGAGLYQMLEISAMAAAEGFTDPSDLEMGPDAIWPEGGRVLHGLLNFNSGRRVTVTNEALFGVLMDNQFGTIPLLLGQVGYPTGGAVEHGEKRDRLAEPGVLYSWLRGNEVNPPESGDIQLLMWGLFEGPSNVFDWYYSARWDIEIAVAGHDRFETEGTWRDAYFNLRTSEVDVPVYALETGLLAGTDEYETYRDLLAPVRGQNRPRSEVGFHRLQVPQWLHLDPVMARRDMNPFASDLATWLLDTTDGPVQVPPMGTPFGP